MICNDCDYHFTRNGADGCNLMMIPHDGKCNLKRIAGWMSIESSPETNDEYMVCSGDGVFIVTKRGNKFFDAVSDQEIGESNGWCDPKFWRPCPSLPKALFD